MNENNEDQELQPSEPKVQSAPDMELIRYKEERAKELGLPSPYGMRLLKELCNDIIASGLAPSCFGKNPLSLYAAVLRGREMGLTVSESIYETFWLAPGGRLGIYSNKMLDLMHRGGVVSEVIEYGANRCEMVFTPQSPFKPVRVFFEIDEAKRAGLIRPDSNWVKWPADMCKARTIARGWRLLLGTFKGSANLYSKEELDEIPDSGQVAQQRLEEQNVMAQFSPGKKRTAKKETVLSTGSSPQPEILSPLNVLYHELQFTDVEQFEKYCKAYGLYNLSPEELSAFTRLTIKLTDASSIRYLYNQGVLYTSIVSEIEASAGNISKLSRKYLEESVAMLLDNQLSALPPTTGEEEKEQ